MRRIIAFITRHPALTYFALTLTISWGAVLFVIGGLAGIPGTMADNDPLFPRVLLAMLAGPSIAGIVLTAIVHGRAGLRAVASRLLKTQVDVRWYAVAILAAPALTTATLLMLSRLSPTFVPRIWAMDDKASFLLFGVAVALGAGFVEELGWTGFATPELLRRYRGLTTGVLMGVMWSVWHWLVVAWGIGDRAGTVPIAAFIVLDTLSVLLAFRVLMVWVYERTGSLLVGMLMHASLTVCTLILWPVTTGPSLLLFDFVMAAALWIVIGVIVAAVGEPDRRRSGVGVAREM
jgi:membrane protease YdiL (CAAX protease family)